MVEIQKTINTKISIAPRYLTANREKTIRWKIFQMKGSCTEEDGYITKIDGKSIKIDDNGLIQTCGYMTVFKVSFSVTFMKPQIGDIITGKISDILSPGFFVESTNMKILVSKNSLLRNVSLKVGEHIENDGKKLKIGDSVRVKIYRIRYKNNNFKILSNLCMDSFEDEIKTKEVPKSEEIFFSDDELSDCDDDFVI